MGVIQTIFGVLFGGGRNVVRETVEIFRHNAEQDAVRGHDARAAALAQFASEFKVRDRSHFDRAIDGLNRLPRPLLALGVIALFVSAMVDPTWFAARMRGLALIPEPLWWLIGVIVSFYFGARFQAKQHEFQASLAASISPSPNPALAEWQEARDE